VVDHATGETWADASRRMDRLAAADLLREACSERYGSVERAVASGLALRHDDGSCSRTHHYQAEVDHLGPERSPAYHYEPETNGVVEKFIQPLKEQVLWIERFETLEELGGAVRAFARTYNRELNERHGYRSPLGRASTCSRSCNDQLNCSPRCPGEPGPRQPLLVGPDLRNAVTLFVRIAGFSHHPSLRPYTAVTASAMASQCPSRAVKLCSM